MRKIIVFLMCVFAVATSVMAAEPTCNGGTPITSHKATDEGCDSATCNGTTFCKSDKTMNWWSAFTWCESQGRQLADLSVICPGVSQIPSNTSGVCPNFMGVDSGWVWSSLALYPTSVAVVNLYNGSIFNLHYNGHTRASDNGYFALCE